MTEGKPMKLEQIGFYTLSDERARNASASAPLSRCELILTGRCNFRCPYCRHVGGKDIGYLKAWSTVVAWIEQGLKAIRFSGGEPTLYPYLANLVRLAKNRGIDHIAVSTNGSAAHDLYTELIDAGVNDFSVSLDACCAEDGEKMTGGVKGAWDRVVDNTRYLASRTYVTVGVVLTPDNAEQVRDIILFADSLGVSDIRVIPAAQEGRLLPLVEVPPELLEKYPILRYRIENLKAGVPVRGLLPSDPKRCGLVLDDMAVMDGEHYPCIIYMREGGSPIGKVGQAMRQERERWYQEHDCHADPICSKNCLDVCVEHNRRVAALRDSPK